MTQLLKIKPSKPHQVIDLVKDAGIDVSDWVNFRDGPRPNRQASNPKYCYEWAFIESGKVVVLCQWYKNLEERNGAIVHEGNARKYSIDQKGLGRHIPSLRAKRVDLSNHVKLIL